MSDAGTASGIMIDREGTPDRDDAIWAEPSGDGWDLAVHITCAADAVPPGSTADRHAARQAESVYLADRTIPMLPRDTVREATLSSRRERPTLLVTWHVAPGGEVSGEQVRESRLCRSAEIGYAAGTAAINDPGHPLHGPMAAAHDAAMGLLARRQAAGAFAVYDLISGWASDGDGGLRQLAVAERHAAYMIVAEFMVAANTIIAGFCVDNSIPVLYRNHQPAAAAPPRGQLIAELREAVAGDAWRREMTRQRLGHLLRPAGYAVHAGEHFGLRLPWYCHATSPLRRYPDLFTQRQLLAVLRGAPRRTPHKTPARSRPRSTTRSGSDGNAGPNGTRKP